MAGHNAQCECSPEVSVKCQTLRLLHLCIESSEHKNYALSRQELEEMKRINADAGILKVEGLDRVDKQGLCKGKDGILAKVVEVLKKSPMSTFQFWLCRVLEAYLRGPVSYCAQIFLLRRKVLQHLVNSLMESERLPKEVIQGAFDLLASLVKNNIKAFQLLNDMLLTEESRTMFKAQINRNLDDSNMFLRSVVMSYAFFQEKLPQHAEYAENTNFILRYISDFKSQISYLTEMLKSVKVQAVSQANVSCLNTALVMLMSRESFGNRNLFEYLKALSDASLSDEGVATRWREESLSINTGENAGPAITVSPVIKEFRGLMQFWKDQYVGEGKVKDQGSLERITGIPFTKWMETVDIILDNDPTSPTSLEYYLLNSSDQ